MTKMLTQCPTILAPPIGGASTAAIAIVIYIAVIIPIPAFANIATSASLHHKNPRIRDETRAQQRVSQGA